MKYICAASCGRACATNSNGEYVRCGIIHVSCWHSKMAANRGEGPDSSIALVGDADEWHGRVTREELDAAIETLKGGDEGAEMETKDVDDRVVLIDTYCVEVCVQNLDGTWTKLDQGKEEIAAPYAEDAVNTYNQSWLYDAEGGLPGDRSYMAKLVATNIAEPDDNCERGPFVVNNTPNNQRFRIRRVN